MFEPSKTYKKNYASFDAAAKKKVDKYITEFTKYSDADQNKDIEQYPKDKIKQLQTLKSRIQKYQEKFNSTLQSIVQENAEQQERINKTIIEKYGTEQKPKPVLVVSSTLRDLDSARHDLTQDYNTAVGYGEQLYGRYEKRNQKMLLVQNGLLQNIDTEIARQQSILAIDEEFESKFQEYRQQQKALNKQVQTGQKNPTPNTTAPVFLSSPHAPNPLSSQKNTVTKTNATSPPVLKKPRPPNAPAPEKPESPNSKPKRP